MFTDGATYEETFLFPKVTFVVDGAWLTMFAVPYVFETTTGSTYTFEVA